MGLVLRRHRPVAKIAMPTGGRAPRIEVLEREVRERVLAIIARQAQVLGLKVEEFVQRLGTGRLDGLIERIDWEADWEAPLRRELAGLTRDALVSVGSGEMQRLGIEQRMSFRLLNPRALAHAEAYVPELVREVTRTTQEAIRDRIGRGFREGRTARQIGVEIREVVGLTSRQAQSVESLRAQLEARGLPEERVARQVQRQHQRMIRERAKMIADTETIRAYNTGIQEAWESAAGEGLVDTDTAKRYWSVAAPRSAGGRACDICTEIAQLNAQGVGLHEPFIMPDGTSLMLPPAHPRCRCGTKMRFT